MTDRFRILRRVAVVVVLGVGGAYGVAQSGGAQAPAPAGAKLAVDAAAFDGEIRPLLQQYCLSCHSKEKHKGDLDLESVASPQAIGRHAKVWQEVAEQLATGEMPPEDEPQPTAAEKQRLSDWVRTTLDAIARSRAGDPGPVVLRRLSNAEYTYTVRDLTGVDSLDPAREFPIDGAAGEGFTNTGQSLVMSPSLVTKYLDAGKAIAGHAVLLPDGFRFSAGTTKRDWTEEILAEIRGFYRQYTDADSGGGTVTLQGVPLDANGGGRLPIEKYLAATLAERDAIAGGGKSVDAVARERGLSPKYLATLLAVLNGSEPSPLLDNVRARWRAAKPGDDVAPIAAEIVPWQQALWKFSSVGHIGKVGGPKAWMEPVNPIAAQHEVRLKLPEAPVEGEVTLYLVASDAGDGAEHDVAVWQQPRLVRPGRPDLLLRDVRAVSRELAARRERAFASAAKCLAAAAEAGATPGGKVDVAVLAARHGVDADALRSWLAYLGIGSGEAVKIDSHFTNKLTKGGGYDFINGWGSNETPSLLANSSDQHVRVPGNMKPHGVAVHPSPKLRVAVGWRSPVAATLRAEATIAHAHPECGNGVAWTLELRRGATRQRLAAGIAHGAAPVKAGPVENFAVQPGDLVALLIGPRDGEHSCDLTAVDLTLTAGGETPRTWDLAADVSPDVHAGNPRADRFGNADVWHFYTEPDAGGGADAVIPDGSLLARWQVAPAAEEKQKLAGEIQTLLTAGPPADKAGPDAKLYQQLASFGGPLLPTPQVAQPAPGGEADASKPAPGPDPALFGRHPDGRAIDPASLCVRAPSVVEVRLPADVAAGCEFVTTGMLDKESGAEGSVQLQVLTAKPEHATGLLPTAATVKDAGGAWTSARREVAYDTPVIVNDGSAARRRIESAFEAFRQLFPPALCYSKVVPVDEVVTLTLFHREDEHLSRLMLDDTQRAKLARLWEELHYVSDDALQLVDALEQIIQYATQDGDPTVFEALREPFAARAAAHRQRLVDTQPKHVDALLAFADRAYRRPLTDAERNELRGLYASLRQQELPHEDAVRLTIARVLVAPAFLYRVETPAPGDAQGPVNDWELANRLSYFLWSSMPDDELRRLAAAGKLREPATLLAQAKRMLGDEQRVRRLATEFGCQWLHVHGFDTLDEKSERHFPTFVELRDDMYEESIRFFADLFQRDASVLSILNADHAFLNEAMAKHYGIPDVTGDAWRRVEGVRKFARGGILAQGATLAKQSGASRTSPILRGNWVAEVLLGDRLPRPPKDVPTLPEDEATETLTVRELTERHSADPRCAGCHVRIDAFGFALEAFDAVGRRRDRDLGDRPIDTKATVMDGTAIDGVDGLREYLLTKRRDAFLRQFCRKLLGYALGRGVQLSDEPLLAEMQSRLAADDYRVGASIEAVVTSRQFLDVRGRDQVADDEAAAGAEVGAGD